MYIGSIDLWERFQNHFKNKDSNIYLPRLGRRAFSKHGINKFSYNILEILENDSDVTKKEFRLKLLELEQYYLDNIKDKYNINLIAGSTLGYQHTEETKLKIGLASSGRVHSEETLALPP